MTPFERVNAIREVALSGEARKIEGCFVNVRAARVFVYLYDKFSDAAKKSLASYPTSRAIWLAWATLEKSSNDEPEVRVRVA